MTNTPNGLKFTAESLRAQFWDLYYLLYISMIYRTRLPETMLYMFADDTKLSRAILDVSDAEILQQDIDIMDEWSREWFIDFHPLKCKVLKMGKMIADLHDIFNPYMCSGSTN